MILHAVFRGRFSEFKGLPARTSRVGGLGARPKYLSHPGQSDVANSPKFSLSHLCKAPNSSAGSALYTPIIIIVLTNCGGTSPIVFALIFVLKLPLRPNPHPSQTNGTAGQETLKTTIVCAG